MVSVTNLTLNYSRIVFTWPEKQTYCGTGTLIVVRFPGKINPLIGISGVAVPTIRLWFLTLALDEFSFIPQ